MVCYNCSECVEENLMIFNKKDKKRSVVFEVDAPHAGQFIDQPKPMTRALPDWWKKFNTFFDDTNKFIYAGQAGGNITMKACMPMLDSMTAGYTITTPMDLQVSIDEGGVPSFRWQMEEYDFITNHGDEQVPDQMVPDEYHRKPFKFTNLYSIKSPPGYSLLFTHPTNRFDLPFLSLTGIVDVDDYRVPVNFPFLLKKNFEGIIEAGTPMIQIIPIKRESWTHEVKKDYNQDEEDVAYGRRILGTRMWKGYKRYFWNRKEYK